MAKSCHVNFYISEASKHHDKPPLFLSDRAYLLVWVRRSYVIILILQPILFVFQEKPHHGSSLTLLCLFVTLLLSVTELKETSIDVRVVVDGAVIVVAHNLYHLLMQLLFYCSVMQARLSALAWKSLENLNKKS